MMDAIKPFACDICEKSFKQKILMKNHMNVKFVKRLSGIVVPLIIILGFILGKNHLNVKYVKRLSVEGAT